MTKADIVNEVSKNTGIEKVTVQKTVEDFMEAVKDSLVDGKNVYLRGFGSFIVKKRAEKTARNISNRILNLPIYYDLSIDDVHRICDIIEYIQESCTHKVL